MRASEGFIATGSRKARVIEASRLFGATALTGGGFSQSGHHGENTRKAPMSPLLARPALATAGLALAVALAGCELMKRNEEALAVVNKRVVGMPAGEFFDRYGRARTRNELGDGSTEYEWISAVAGARPGPAGLDDRICRLRLASDRNGRISRVQVLYDAPGNKSTSRCGEIFSPG
jgi:hypothetical protein